MPIDYKEYPDDWKQIRMNILIRAGNKCEECGVENHPSVEFVFMSAFGKEYYSNFMDQTNKPNVTFMEAFFDDNEFAKILSIEPIPIKVNKLITPNRRTS